MPWKCGRRAPSAPTQEGFWGGMTVVGKELGPDDPDLPSRLAVFLCLSCVF